MNNASGEDLGAPFADDARFINTRGEHHRGKDAIAQGHQEIFDSVYKGNNLAYDLFDLNPVSDTDAVAHIRATLKAPSGPLAGEHYSVASFVLVQIGENWCIASFHNTMVLTQP